MSKHGGVQPVHLHLMGVDPSMPLPMIDSILAATAPDVMILRVTRMVGLDLHERQLRENSLDYEAGRV